MTATVLEAQGRRALARLGGRVALAYLAAVVVGLVVTLGRPGLVPAGAVTVLAAIGAVITSRLTVDPSAGSGGGRPAHGRLLAARLAVVGCGALVLVVVGSSGLSSDRLDVLCGWILPGVAGGLALATGPRCGWTALGVLAVVTVVGAGFPLARAAGLVAGAAVTVAVCSAVRIVAERGFRETEALLAAADDAAAARVAAEQRLAGRRRLDRLLHDTVLGSLTLVAHHRPGPALPAVRESCRRDLDILGMALAGVEPPQTGPGTPPDDGGYFLTERLVALRDLAAARGVDLRVHVQDDASEGSPDPAVRAAWAGAVAECVTNITRHASVGAADLVVGRTRDALLTVVVDEGAGFDPGTVPAERLGLSGSVRERLEDVGGRATVWSRPGHGTVIELLLPWPRSGATPGAGPATAPPAARTTPSLDSPSLDPPVAGEGS